MATVQLQATISPASTVAVSVLHTVDFNNEFALLETLVTAGKYDIVIEQGALSNEVIRWVDAVGDPQDLTGYAAKLRAMVLQRDGQTLFELDSPNHMTLTAATGEIEINLTESESEALDFELGVYDLLLYPPRTPINNYLMEPGVDFTSAAVDADDGNGRAVVTLTGGTFNYTLLPGDVVHIYDTENNDVNGGVYTVYSQTSTILTLTTTMAGDNSTDTSLKIQALDTDNVIRLLEGNVYLHRRVTQA